MCQHPTSPVETVFPDPVFAVEKGQVENVCLKKEDGQLVTSEMDHCKGLNPNLLSPNIPKVPLACLQH